MSACRSKFLKFCPIYTNLIDECRKTLFTILFFVERFLTGGLRCSGTGCRFLVFMVIIFACYACFYEKSLTEVVELKAGEVGSDILGENSSNC
jgi:hypothetical protein